MIEGKSVLAVVPARGGSKGIKMKNLLKLNGKTLIAHTADAIKKCEFIDESVVSTDHKAIKDEALKSGLKVPFTRPGWLSDDFVSDIEVLKHAVRESEKAFGHTFDIILMLQPNSPIKHRKYILKCINNLIKDKLDSCFTVSKTDSKFHPLKQLKVINNKAFYYDPAGESIVARQMLNPIYHRNGVCYAFTRQCIMEKGKVITDNCSVVIIDEFTVNIDTRHDFKLAELFFKGAL